MHKLMLFFLFLVVIGSPAFARGRLASWCMNGNQSVVTVGVVNSTTKVQRSYPGCTVTVYLPGTVTLASIYSDDNGTAKANPFAASTTSGQWFFYADNGNYDVRFSGAGIATPFTLGDVPTIDPQAIGGVRYADTFSGADACVKIQAAITNLPATGGTVDARAFEGPQACSINPYAGTSKSVTLLVGAAIYQAAVPWVVSNKSRLIGVGRGDELGFNTTIQANIGFATTTPVVQSCASADSPCFGVQVEHLGIDCNGISGCIGAENDYAQEQSWWKDILVINAAGACFAQDVGINVTSASQNSGPNVDLECNQGTAAVAGSLCYKVNLVPSWRGLDGMTCNADGYTTIPTNAILLTGIAPGSISNVHIEHFTNGIVLGSAAASGTISDVVIKNVSTGPDNTNSVVIAAAGASGKQNITISGVQNSTLASSVVVDNCNSVTLAAATAGAGTYATGYGACGSQTIFTTRKDAAINLQTSVNVLKSLTTPGTITGVDDGSWCFGPALPFCIYAHESGVSGVGGPVIKTQNLGLLIQNGQVTAGAVGGGLALNGNGFGTNASNGQIGAGATSDMGTFTARSANAAQIQFADGITYFLSDSSLTPGSTYTPTARWQIGVNGMLRNTTPVAFASLGAPNNGTIVYCNDCTNASNPCTGAGTGAFAKRLAGAWDCR